MKQRLPIFIAAVVCLVALGGIVILSVGEHEAPVPANPNAEPVQDFSSEIRVSPDAKLRVTEIVRAKSEGKELKHGMVRAFLVPYVDEFTRSYTPSFGVESAKRNGVEIHWNSPEPKDGAILFYLGDPNIEIEPGPQEFVFQYRVDGRVAQQNDFAYLSWEVNPAWPLVMGRVVVEVRVPQFVEAESIRYSARIVGASEDHRERPAVQGKVSPEISAQVFDAGKIDTTAKDVMGVKFASTRPLQPFERLVVTVWWPAAFMKPEAMLVK